MNLPSNYQCEGQMSIEDLFGQDIWFGKMSQELSAQTKARTSEQCLKKLAELRIKPPQYLCLKRVNGVIADASWEMGGPLLGVYTMRSFGEYPSDERESRLSQILEENPQQKYSLSAKACQGILNRAQRRGKTLPEQLEKALIRQSASKSAQGNLGGGKGILIQNERTGALSTLNNQSVLQKCLNSWDVQSKHIQPQDGKAEALYSGECRGGGGESYVMQSPVYCLQGNGIDRAETAGCNGKGWRENESYTLNTIDRPAVVTFSDTASARLADDGPKGVHSQMMNNPEDNFVIQKCYGLDRASFNQGKNAKYDFSVQEEIAQPIVARGPGGGTENTVGALCARDFKGVGNQYVNEGKCIIQRVGESSSR